MKKLLVLVFAALMAVGLTACGSSGGGDNQKSALPELATLGDAFALEAENTTTSWDTENYVLACDYNGVPIRVVAKMTEDLYKQVEAIDFADADHDKKVQKLLGSLKVESVEDLSQQIPAQEELDKFVGKTAQDLLDAEYAIDGYNLEGENAEYTMSNGPFTYTVTFNEHVDYTDDFDENAAAKDLTVKNIKYFGVSQNATDLTTAK